MRGIFITFEGTEGSGKTTIIKYMEKDLKSLNYDVIVTREPGGSKISEEIRKVILDVDNREMDRRTEALLYAASRRQHQIEIIEPALSEGKIILCDRGIDSSLAYQGYARGLGIDSVYAMNQFATLGLLPDLTIYIDVKPKVGLDRIVQNKRNINRLDSESIDFHNKVYQGYQEVLKIFPERIKVINGDDDINTVYMNVYHAVLSFLEKNNGR